jgi:hypothetical protein
MKMLKEMKDPIKDSSRVVSLLNCTQHIVLLLLLYSRKVNLRVRCRPRKEKVMETKADRQDYSTRTVDCDDWRDGRVVLLVAEEVRGCCPTSRVAMRRQREKEKWGG